MEITRRKPKSDQVTVRENASMLPTSDIVERFLDDFWQPFGVMPRLNQWMPRVDVEEKDKEYVITADIPGVDPKDVTIEIVGDTLQLHGRSESEHSEHKGQYYRLERQSGAFSRSFTLPSNIDSRNITAETKHGTMKVTLPKTTEAEPERRKIDIRNIDENSTTENHKRQPHRKTIE